MQNKVTTRRCPSKSIWHWHHVPSTVLASWMTLWLKCGWKVWADDVSRHDNSSIYHATHTYWLVSHTHTLMHTYWCTHTHTHTHTQWHTLTWSDTDRHTDCCTDTHTHTHISIPRHGMTYKSLSVVVCLRMVLYDFSLRIQKPPHNCTVVAISQWASPVYYGYHIVRLVFWVYIYIYWRCTNMWSHTGCFIMTVWDPISVLTPVYIPAQVLHQRTLFQFYPDRMIGRLSQYYILCRSKIQQLGASHHSVCIGEREREREREISFSCLTRAQGLVLVVRLTL